jgi:hypothetical protein
VLLKHKLKCEKHEYCKIIIPENPKLEFTKYNFRNKLPFVIYADFETISKTIYGPNNFPDNKFKKLKHQTPAAVGILIKTDFDYISLADRENNYFSYIGEDVVNVFCNFLIKIEEEFSKIFETDLEMKITTEEQNDFENTKQCYYCKKDLLAKLDKVRDHDHLTGKYRSAAHSKCNILARKDKFVPIFFHNLSNYDAHLFIKTLAELIKDHPNWRKRELKLLAKNSEEYISFQFGCLRFLDSYRFLQASLDNATKSRLIMILK